MAGSRSTSKNAAKTSTAVDVWRLLAEVVQKQFRDAMSLLQQEGLTPGHLKTLLLLAPGEPLPMGSLAQALTCDASTATWLVDRLEERGLVERRMLQTDRRVKTVVLTETGIKTAAAVQKRLYTPPPQLLELDDETLATLRDALSSLKDDAAPAQSALR
ncbi:MAG: MarR family winged helix-turn-helix transcriptional regulator [Actinomycetota bacterium]